MYLELPLVVVKKEVSGTKHNPTAPQLQLFFRKKTTMWRFVATAQHKSCSHR
jgi:hypothetical protein